jgi:hypothetical protein
MELGARSESPTRAVYLGRPLPRAEHTSARAALSPSRNLRPARAGAGELDPMDARAATPLTPSYSRDPSTAAAAAANPSAGSVGLASAGAPPSIGLARGLFMPPRMSSEEEEEEETSSDEEESSSEDEDEDEA